MRRRSSAALLAIALAGCADEAVVLEVEDQAQVAESAAGVTALPAEPAAAPGAIEGRATMPIDYSCEALKEPPLPTTSTSQLTRRLLEAAPPGSFERVSSHELVESLLRSATEVSLDTLSLRDRILMQASALRTMRSDRDLAAAAGVVVKRMALDARELTELGGDPRRELEPWLGSAESWVERKGPACGPLGVHDAAYGGALAFRTIRAGDKRVLFAQVVALDSELRPHVTPVVALVELRSGMRADAPACVLEATPTGLSAVPFDALHRTPFISPQPDQKVGCNGCHDGRGQGDLADLGREEGGAFRIERRLALSSFAESRAKALRTELGLR